MYHWSGRVPRAGAPAETEPPLELTRSATMLSWTQYCDQMLVAVAYSNGKGIADETTVAALLKGTKG